MNRRRTALTRRGAMAIVRAEVGHAFDEAIDLQGCRAPWEIDALRRGLERQKKAVLATLAELPDGTLIPLASRLKTIWDEAIAEADAASYWRAE